MARTWNPLPAWLACHMLVSLATTAGAADAELPSPPGDASASDSRMERARREASRPYRMIIEAAKVDPPPEPRPPAGPAKPISRPVGKSPRQAAATPVDQPTRPADRTTTTPVVTAPTGAPVSASGEDLTVTQSVNSEPAGPAPLEGVAADTESGKDTTVAQVATDERATATPAVMPPRPVELARQANPNTTPEGGGPALPGSLVLKSTVTPNPERALCASRGCAEGVGVRFTVRPDGRVTDASLIRRASNDLFNRAVLEAVLQWRYHPIAQDTQHTVILRLTQ